MYVYFRIVQKNPKKGQIRTTKLVPTYHISLPWYISLTLFLTDQVSCSEILLSYHFFPFFIGLLLLCYMICTNYRGIFLKGWLNPWIRGKLSSFVLDREKWLRTHKIRKLKHSLSMKYFLLITLLPNLLVNFLVIFTQGFI